MARLTKAYKQVALDEYLNATGRNTVVVQEFLEWLRPQTDHPAWHLLFHGTLEEKALEAEIQRCRKFINGLRCVVIRSVPTITPVTVPAWTSVATKRSEYASFDVNDATMRERELGVALGQLRSWGNRYSAIAETHGADISMELTALVARLEAAL